MLLVLVLVMMLVQVLVLIILIEMSPEMMLPLLVFVVGLVFVLFALAEMKGMAVLLYIVVKFLNGWISCGL